jgi:hypothetical protein
LVLPHLAFSVSSVSALSRRLSSSGLNSQFFPKEMTPVAQKNPLASLTVHVLQMNSDLKVLKKTVYLLKVLIALQLYQGHTDQIETFLRRFAEAERGFDPDKQTLDAALRALKFGTPISES